MLIFGFYIAQNNKNPHVTLFQHCISKTAHYSILSPFVKKSYLGDQLLNLEYQLIVRNRPIPRLGSVCIHLFLLILTVCYINTAVLTKCLVKDETTKTRLKRITVEKKEDLKKIYFLLSLNKLNTLNFNSSITKKNETLRVCVLVTSYYVKLP